MPWRTQVCSGVRLSSAFFEGALEMSTALVNLTVISKRMLSKREAAEHCGRSLKRFEVECPMSPIRFANGDLRYDVRDLDAWLDGFKAKSEDSAMILKRLANHDHRSR